MASSKQRELTVLKRAVCKKASTSYGVQAGDLIFLVKNDKEDVYTTILRNTGKHTCTCQGNASFGRKCYHIKHVECQENIRRESAKLAPEFAAVKLPVWAMWLLESGVLVAPQATKVERIAQDVGISAEQVAEIAVIAAEHKAEMTDGKHTEMCLPIGPRDTKKDMMKAALTKNSGFSVLRKVG